MRAADYFQRRRAARDSDLSGPSLGLPEAATISRNTLAIINARFRQVPANNVCNMCA